MYIPTYILTFNKTIRFYICVEKYLKQKQTVLKQLQATGEIDIVIKDFK
jgi:hypothetical protein